jgi:hypothetical protein
MALPSVAAYGHARPSAHQAAPRLLAPGPESSFRAMVSYPTGHLKSRALLPYDMA